ncbi:probable 2-oxoglutarate-dependent dioxygenase AOP1 [Impatiens glandulifera]|uniref:probable 2-oxoglutarate-dependent dioxygenase AOP1 n=1 Tax=Impatiens glandulifera TaxID=253017 RepID=UPI001FB072E1|nr:probable 2-oxoglutarate-dependent dioxygenase AOP1 [Impatiens glandulifera]
MEASQIQIPTIVMNKELMKLNEDSEERKTFARKIREACENYGCFLIDSAMISEEEQHRFFTSSKEFFALPVNIKKQYGMKPKLWHGGYVGINPYITQESFGVYGLPDDEIRSLAGHICSEYLFGMKIDSEVNQSMKMKLMDVLLSVMELTFEDLGISDYYNKHAENVTCLMRSLKDKLLPKNNDEKPTQGPMPHVDHSILSILYHNGIQGVEILSNDGEWARVTIPKGSLLVTVGDAFEVWSNGKFRAVKHRGTVHAGDKDKYTCVLFMLPKDGVMMEVPPELVAEGDSPLFRSFVYSDYLEKHSMDPNVEAIKVFAGVNGVV